MDGMAINLINPSRDDDENWSMLAFGIFCFFLAFVDALERKKEGRSKVM